MRMGELSACTHTNRQTIHYYLRKGYLHPAIYKEATDAFYDESHIEKINYLVDARKRGIPLQVAAEHWVRDKRKKKPPRHDGIESSTRNRIIREASRVFLARGYHQTTISDIVDNVGVTKAAFYYYFENKKDLYFSCIDTIFRSFFKSSLEAIAHERDPLRRWEIRWEFMKNFLPEIFTILQLAKESLREEDEQYQKKVKEALHKGFVGPLIDDIRMGIDRGIFRPVEGEIAAFALLSLFEAIGYRSFFEGNYSDAQLWQQLFDVMFHGLYSAEVGSSTEL